MSERELFYGESCSANLCLDEADGECIVTMLGASEEQSCLSPETAFMLAERLLAFAGSHGFERANQAGER